MVPDIISTRTPSLNLNWTNLYPYAYRTFTFMISLNIMYTLFSNKMNTNIINILYIYNIVETQFTEVLLSYY